MSELASTSTTVAAAPPTPSIARVRQFLYRRLRVTLVSQRVLLGDFSCLDKQGNLILSNTFEEVISTSGGREERLMGLVLVPIAQQAKIELQASVDEELGRVSIFEPAPAATLVPA